MKFEKVPTSKAEEKNNKETESFSDVRERVKEEELARREAEIKSNERFNTDRKDKETDIESREVDKKNISENLAPLSKSFSDVREEVEEKRSARREAEKDSNRRFQ